MSMLAMDELLHTLNQQQQDSVANPTLLQHISCWALPDDPTQFCHVKHPSSHNPQQDKAYRSLVQSLPLHTYCQMVLPPGESITTVGEETLPPPCCLGLLFELRKASSRGYSCENFSCQSQLPIRLHLLPNHLSPFSAHGIPPQATQLLL
jgi:hypothetical protein